jgi:hypothetical protein
MCNSNGIFHGLDCVEFNDKIALTENSLNSENKQTWTAINLADNLHGFEFFEWDFECDFRSEVKPIDFTVLLNWKRLRRSPTCQLDTEQYDPIKQTCRTAFMETESKCKIFSFDFSEIVSPSINLDPISRSI